MHCQQIAVQASKSFAQSQTIVQVKIADRRNSNMMSNVTVSHENVTCKDVHARLLPGLRKALASQAESCTSSDASLLAQLDNSCSRGCIQR